MNGRNALKFSPRRELPRGRESDIPGDIVDLTPLESIISVGNYLVIRGNKVLTSLNGLQNLTSVGGGLCEITHNYALTSFDGLESLESIGGFLQITNHEALTNIDGLRNLIYVGAHIAIYDNPALVRFCGLYALFTEGTVIGPVGINFNGANPSPAQIVAGGPCVITVAIDIKPGSDPNCINNDGHGVIPVAILGSAEFDATQIDPETVQLEGLAIRVVGKSNKYLAHIEDVNNDGFDDLVVQIEDKDGVFSEGTTIATVTGNLFDGTVFEGSDEIIIVPPGLSNPM